MAPPEPVADGDGVRCDNCGLPLPGPAVTEQLHGQTYHFCSESCHAAFHDHDTESTSIHQFKRRPFEVAGLDDQLPEGFPRNSLVLLSSVPGTAEESVHAELVWRTLGRGEPAIVVAFEEPPFAVVEFMLSMEWNVIPYLEDGTLRIVDCFTDRVTTYRWDPDRLTDWNRYVYEITAEATARVSDFTSFSVLHDHLDTVVEAVDAYDAGLVLIDSLDELAVIQPTNALPFVKDLRADFCKGRLVPVLAGATYVFDDTGFPQNVRYFADGIVEFDTREGGVGASAGPGGTATGSADAGAGVGAGAGAGDGQGGDAPGAGVAGPFDGGTLERTVRVLKMQGVKTWPRRIPYEFERGVGLVPTDPGPAG